MRELYEKVEFILNGGALNHLSDLLSAEVSSALIVQPEGEDLVILDGVGASTSSLHMRRLAGELQGLFPPRSASEPGIRVDLARSGGMWPCIVRLCGIDWRMFLLLGEEPSQNLLDQLKPAASLVGLWQESLRRNRTEERLSRLAYMILATKSTLASVFEPMPLDYFIAFLADVLGESLFPSRISIVVDDGVALSAKEGEAVPDIERTGVFRDPILSPVPIRIDREHRELLGERNADLLAPDYSVLLPIPGCKRHVYCLLAWTREVTEEDMNFMELLGNVAAKAMSLGCLSGEREASLANISRKAFGLESLHQATLRMMEQRSREDLFLLILEIFSEMSQARTAHLVIWQPRAGGYVRFARRQEGRTIAVGVPQAFPVLLAEDRETPPSLPASIADEYFRSLGVRGLADLPDRDSLEYYFLFWDEGRLLGYAAVTGAVTGSEFGDLSLLETLANAASTALRSRSYDEPSLAAGKVLHVKRLISGEIDRAYADILEAGLDCTVLECAGAPALSEAQQTAARLVVIEDDATRCVLPGSWENDLRALFPPEAGWRLRTGD